MGTTLDFLTGSSGVRIQTTVAIEGWQTVATDGDPDAAFNAYDGASDACFRGCAALGAVGGLSVHWDMQQRISPWKPMTEPMTVRFSVVPAGTAEGATADVIGAAVFKRTGGTETHITADLDCNDTTVTCQRVDDFAASGYLYAGPEAMTYSSRDTGADTFTVDQRGHASVFSTSSGANFARTHKPATASEYSLPPLIGTEPRTWVGRWVAIYLHKVNENGGLDSPAIDGSGAHLAFAGRIVGVEDVDGATVFTCEDVRRRIYETVLMRDPFRARLAEGYRLQTGDRFSIKTTRQVSGGGLTVGNGNDLLVVSGAPASSNEIQAGRYTSAELAERLNVWLQGERGAARIIFNLRYDGMFSSSSGTRARMSYSDPTTTANLLRLVRLTSTGSCRAALENGGWEGGGGTVAFDGDASAGAVVSPRAPSLFADFSLSGNTGTIYEGLTLEDAQGTWVSQSSLLPIGWGWPGNGIDGILKIGDYGYLRVKRVSDTSFNWTIGTTGMDQLFTQGRLSDLRYLTVDDAASVEVSQVLVLSSTFGGLLLQILLSTGTSGFNHGSYDTLGEQLGCGIPYSIGGAGLITDVTNLAEANEQLMTVIDKPTRFGELFEADFILRRCFFVWGAGRLQIKTWATPVSGYASTTLTETTKATPFATLDTNRASIHEDDDFYNIVKIQYNLRSDGSYESSLKIIDAASVRSHGERIFTIKARNTFGQGSPAPIEALLATFTSFFQMTSKPLLVIKRSIDFNKFETTIPGTILTVTDTYLRNPATGLRYSNLTATGGLSGFPGMVVGQRFDWGGSESSHDSQKPVVRDAVGELEIMISPIRTQAVYVPCAQVDDTAAGSGYNAGTKVLTCYAHEHSESSETADAARFVATDKVKVIELDPDDPASHLSWSDTVASQTGNTITLTTGLAGFDTAKKYRVIYDAYATCTAAQQAKCFQADDADGLIVDTTQAFGLGFFGSSQSTTVTLSDETDTPSRHSTLAYGDGKPLDTGYERDACRLANSLVNLKYGRQVPTAYASAELRNYTGSGTYQLVEVRPIFLGIQTFTAGRTRYLRVAPRIRSTDGNTANCRVTLARRMPTGATRDDINRLEPYESNVFTTTSTTFSIPSAADLNTKHCKMEDALHGGIGGVAYLYVEINSKCEYTGMARCAQGVLE